MDDKTSLHNDDPFNPAAEAANAPEATIAAVPETPPDEVMAALEMLAAFSEDPVQPVEGGRTTIEAGSDVQLVAGPEAEAAPEEMVAEFVPEPITEPVLKSGQDTTAAGEGGGSLATLPEAPWAIPTHAEHRDGPPMSPPDDEQADEPFDTIEDGIASIFARLHAESQEAQVDEHEEQEDEGSAVDDAVTFQLLGELDRLWHRAER